MAAPAEPGDRFAQGGSAAAWQPAARRVARPASGGPRPGSTRSPASALPFPGHQRATALVEGPEGLLGRDGADQLVVVPGPLGLARGLDLEQVHRVQLAPVRPDLALAE